MAVAPGNNWLGWVIRLVAAVLTFLIVRWLLPLLFTALTISIPAAIVLIIALLAALLVFVGYSRIRR